MEEKNFTTTFLGKDYPVFYIKDRTKAIQALEKLSTYDVLFGIDIETASLPEYRHIAQAALSPHLSEPRLVQIYNQKSIVVLDMYHCMCWGALMDFINAKRFIAHNAVFEMAFLSKVGAKNLNFHCSYLMAKCLFHATRADDGGLSASLEGMVQGLFGEGLAKDVQNSKWHEPDLTFEQIEYAAKDAPACFVVGEKLAGYLSKYNLNRYYKLVKEAQYPLVQMQLNGLGFDADAHAETIDTWGQQLFMARNKLLKMTGLQKITAHTMSAYLEEVLDKQTLDIWPRTDPGKLSTDANAFVKFSYLKIVKPFSEYQKLDKMVSSFGEKLLHSLNPSTKRLHANYRLCGARTGRLSCTSPNLQQLPRDSAVRNHFVAGPGRLLLCADYSQIEIRVAAELSRDETMLSAYRKGIDIHSLTASVVSGKPIGQVDRTDRQLAKCINFGLMFGLGARNFSHYAKKSYGVEISSAKSHEAVDAFRDTYAGYHEWQKLQVERAQKTFKTTTPCGKLRKLAAEDTYGTAMNHPVQGGAAECMLSALIRLQSYIDHQIPDAKLVNCVHDEILVECSVEQAKDVADGIVFAMVEGFKDVFPQGITNGLTDVKDGTSWGECKSK